MNLENQNPIHNNNGSKKEEEEEDKLGLKKWRKPECDFETLAIVETIDRGKFTNCLVCPIVTSSVFVSKSSVIEENNNSLFHYSRCGNYTRSLLESSMAKLDGAKYALAFSSGVAAISGVVQIFSGGDHMLYVQTTNGDADWLFRHKWKHFGFEVEFVYTNDCNEILTYIKPNTKLVWLESPANPTLTVVDIESISNAVHNIDKNIVVAVDNTFLTPIFQRPLSLGADVAVYSCTKYICGHADVTMGIASINSDDLYKRIQDNQICLGGIPSPFDCYLIIRSIKTLPLRMNQHFINGMKIALFLETHPAVDSVSHPGLKSHPQHQLALRQQMGHSGMVGFYIKGDMEVAQQFIDNLNIFRNAPSLGTDVSICSIPSIASHGWLPEDEKIRLGIKGNYIRLSVGLESAQALIEDLDSALRKTVKID